MEQLHCVDERLWIEMSRSSDPTREFIVTAQGNAEAFDIAESLIAAAPEMPGWQMTALKPATGFDFKTESEGLLLDSREMWFLPLENPDLPHSLGLRIGVQDLEPERNADVLNAVLMMLDTGLGERTAAIAIQHVEVSSLPPNPESLGYIELPELSDYLAWRRRKGNSQGSASAAESP
ncbi:MAG TPA: hypothetical protein VHX60_05690 [Acidobacteriaceae bacterium]|nr:hypothetical protein [Acidobacteriaceae bacterium]